MIFVLARKKDKPQTKRGFWTKKIKKEKITQ